MRVGSIHQKVIELMHDFFSSSSEPLDRFLKSFFIKNRYIGSSDRRNINSIAYGILSQRQYLHENYESITAKKIDIHNVTMDYWRHILMLYLCNIGEYDGLLLSWDSSVYSPRKIEEHEIAICKSFIHGQQRSRASSCNVPAWLYDFASIKDILWEEQNQKPSVDLWVNTNKTSAEKLKNALQKLGAYFTIETFESVRYLRSEHGTIANLNKSKIYEAGMFEFQDAGSQNLSSSLPYLRGNVLELCAGAGGKTLNLALKISQMPASDRKNVKLFITDVDGSRLARAMFRIRRAGLEEFVTPIDYLDKFKFAPYDGIFIDAPCSGTGVWRRHPEDRWLLNQERLMQLITIQKDLIKSAADNIKKQGWISYATCSVLPQENEQIVNYALNLLKNCDTRYKYTSPTTTHTDAFFLATLQLL